MTNTKKKILIAEDNPALLAVVKFNLEASGFETTGASNGEKALSLAMESDHDLLITDHQMPGLSGVALVTKLRKQPKYKSTPILMLTAKSLELDLDLIINHLHVRQVFSKPFSPSEIVNTVNEIFATQTV